MSSYQKWKIKSEQIKNNFQEFQKFVFLSSSFINNDLLLQQVHFAGRISFLKQHQQHLQQHQQLLHHHHRQQ